MEKSIFTNLVRASDGSVSTMHEGFELHSALQPIFREAEDGTLYVEAFEGLIRAGADGRAYSPADFFSHVRDEDRAMVDSLCRSLHILNAGALGRRDAILLVNFNPGLFTTRYAIRQEIDRMKLVAHEASLSVGQIACEICERPGDDPEVLGRFSDRLHDSGFLVAIDEYSGDDRCLERLWRLKPDLVKFDSAWVRSFVENSAGVALLRVVVGQFVQQGIRPLLGGIEEPWQIELCRDLGGPLMQGYLLARPEIAPTDFNQRFPESDSSLVAETNAQTSPLQRSLPAPVHQPSNGDQSRPGRPQRQFGRRGL
ncbi:EAL domain-containing protein [Sinorhizobium sp. BG8]|uniref:EAL domain-containing protein n=1 Tax=Sinorhizobium sp. BG8 TaxID=2613773 RepID=UPI001FEE48F8|nr:EAL domain-containing protein [Sinorhizobium sp. BG8]